MRKFHAFFALVLVAVGCRSKPTESKGTQAAPPSSAAASAGVLANSAAAPLGSNDAAAELLPAPAPAKIVASTLTLAPQLLGEGNLSCPFVLHNPRGAVVVASCEELFVLQDGNLKPAKLPTTGFGVDHSTQEQNNVREVHRVTGRWPDALVVDLTRMDPMGSDRGTYFVDEETTYELVGGHWREVLGEPTPQAAAWNQGRTLVFRRNEFSLLAGRKDLPLPVRAPSTRDCGASNVSDFTAMADGTVVTVGISCDEPKHFRAEIIGEGRPGVDYDLKSATHALPKAEPRIAGDSREALFAMVPTERGVILWQYTKAGFVEVSTPVRLPLAAAHVTASGQLWLAFVGPTRNKGKAEPAHVYRRMPSGIWESVRLPSSEVLHSFFKTKDQTRELRFVPGSIASFGDGQVWLAGTAVEGVDTEVGSILARAGDEVVATAPEVGARPGPETPEAYRSGCESPFVLLYSVADSVPADYSFPATRDALRGSEFLTSARFVEFRYKDKRTLGALVSSEEKGKALILRLTAGVRGSKPQLMCFAPKSVEREVSLK